jgi:hypothetical protein
MRCFTSKERKTRADRIRNRNNKNLRIKILEDKLINKKTKWNVHVKNELREDPKEDFEHETKRKTPKS